MPINLGSNRPDPPSRPLIRQANDGRQLQEPLSHNLQRAITEIEKSFVQPHTNMKIQSRPECDWRLHRSSTSGTEFRLLPRPGSPIRQKHGALRLPPPLPSDHRTERLNIEMAKQTNSFLNESICIDSPGKTLLETPSQEVIRYRMFVLFCQPLFW